MIPMGTFSKNKRKQRYEFSHQEVNMSESMNENITSTDVLNYGVLIVDDESNIRLLLAEFLKNEGFEYIYIASGSKQCFDCLREHGDNIVIILMDIKLHNESGIDLIENIRRDYKRVVGVIIHSAFSFYKDDPSLQMVHERVAVLDYVVKNSYLPDLFDSLHANIPKVLKRRHKLMDITNPSFETKSMKNIAQIIE
jgi:DNA-binding response OmpR family regulator